MRKQALRGLSFGWPVCEESRLQKVRHGGRQKKCCATCTGQSRVPAVRYGHRTLEKKGLSCIKNEQVKRTTERLNFLEAKKRGKKTKKKKKKLGRF